METFFSPLEIILGIVINHIEPGYVLCVLVFTELLKMLFSNNSIYQGFTPWKKRRWNLFLSLLTGISFLPLFFWLRGYSSWSWEIQSDYWLRIILSYGLAVTLYQWWAKYLFRRLRHYLL